MKTTKLTMAQALVRFLDNVYLDVDGKEVKFVHGMANIFGHGNVLGVGEALALNEHNLKIYQGKNEQGMAQMAIGFAKQKNRQQIIACSSSVGPGAANMVTAAGTATANHIPLLLLPGDTFASRRPDPVLQQVELSNNLNTTTNDAFKAVSKYWDRISRPEQLINSLIWAFEVLTNPALTGAVTIALPQDVQGMTYDYPNWFLEKRVYKLRRLPAEKSDLIRAFELISSSQRPLIVVGGGSRYSQAGKEISQLSKLLQAPLAFTQAGKSSLLVDEDYYLGGIGVTGNESANLYARDADLVIGIGTRYTDFTSGSKIQFNPQAKFLNINVNQFDAIKMRGYSILADAKVATQQLITTLKEMNFQAKDNLALIRKLQRAWKATYESVIAKTSEAIKKDPLIKDGASFLPQKWEEDVTKHYGKKIKIFSQMQALDIIQKNIKKDASIVASSGSLPGDLQRFWEPTAYNTYNVEYGYSCMGHELSGGVGAAIANQKPTYALLGDGSFVMLHSELLTALQESVPFVAIVMDNGGFSVINNLQVGHQLPSFETQFHHRKEFGSNEVGDLIVVDYATIAKGYGIDAKLVTSEEELVEILKVSQNITKPLLIEIKVYPKSMSPGYESMWQVGLAQSSKDKKVEALAASENLIWEKRNERN